ncbi:MAG: hypothetical protein M3P38_03250 [Chloroflexota bacterium]|nr:hypothetical protein [Chloroflexota bacterium]
MRELRIPRRALWIGLAVVVAVAIVAVAARTGVLASSFDPVAIADSRAIGVQRTAAERGIQRAYANAVEQLRKTRELRLAITAQQAAAIETKTVAALKTLRNSAFVSVAEAFGQSGEAAQRYATETAARFDASSAAPPSDVVLLAPRLYSIVARMSQLAAQLADNGTREMTNPDASPSPSRSP